MSRTFNKASIGTLLKTYKTIIAGAVVLLVGIPLYVVGLDLIVAESACAYKGGKFPPGSGEFVPGTSIVETCSVMRDYGQDLSFWAQFRSHQTGEVIPIPAQVEIRDPNDVLIFSRQFNEGTIVVYVDPNVFGNYSATITSLEDPDARVTSGSPPIEYAFGYLTSNGYEGVNNPVGTAIEIMVVSGNLMIVAGIGVMIFGAVQRYRRKKAKTVVCKK